MSFTFRKSWKILPGVRLNVGKKSHSFTVGPRWFKRTFSSTGRTTTSADLPGPFGWRTSRRQR
ncbi:DUF4236 domain-containing protein [Streptomyces sp. NPDC004031]